MGRILATTAVGSAVGSSIIGLWCLAWSLIGGLKVDVALVGGIVAGMAFAYSLVPVLIVTAALAPLTLRLSRRNGETSGGRYFLIGTALVSAPWLLLGPQGLVGAAAMLLTYGYPAMAFHLHLSRERARARKPASPDVPLGI